MNIILDLIVIAIIILITVISAKQGFVRVAVEVVGFIIAIVLSLNISVGLADVTYHKVIEPVIVSSVENVTADTTVATAEKTWNALPQFVRNGANKLGIDEDTITESIAKSVGNGAGNVAASVSENTVKPIATSVLKTLYSLILILVLMIIVKFLARLVNKLFSFSIVGKLNKFLGGTLGVVKGIIIAWLFCTVVSLAVSFTQNGILFFNAENIDNTIIFKFLTDVVQI